MTKRQGLVNRICVVLLLAGALVLAVFAVRGEPQRPAVDTAKAIIDAHFAFVTIRDLSYDRPDTEAMLESAWQSGLKAAAIPGKPSRSTLDDQEWALEADVEFLLARARSRSVDAIIDSYIWGLADGAGDPHTYYVPMVVEPPAGETGALTHGITSVPESNQYRRIIALEPDSPTIRAGLRVNDLIREIPIAQGSGRETDDLLMTFEVLRGEAGARLKHRLLVTVQLYFAEPELVTVTDLGDGNKLLAVHSFSGRIFAFDDQLTASDLTGLNNRVIVDLRGNPGGFLTNAANLLMELGYEGQMVTSEYRWGQESDRVVRWPEWFTDRSKPSQPSRLIVLLNEETASAAEIAAWMLKTHLRATVVGTPTRGISRGSMWHLVGNGVLNVATIRNLLGPELVDINRIGITPDIIVEQDNAGLAAGRDNVLERAIQLLTED